MPDELKLKRGRPRKIDPISYELNRLEYVSHLIYCGLPKDNYGNFKYNKQGILTSYIHCNDDITQYWQSEIEKWLKLLKTERIEKTEYKPVNDAVKGLFGIPPETLDIKICYRTNPIIDFEKTHDWMYTIYLRDFFNIIQYKTTLGWEKYETTRDELNHRYNILQTISQHDIRKNLPGRYNITPDNIQEITKKNCYA